MSSTQVDVAALDSGVRYSVLESGVRLGTDVMPLSRSVSIACFVGVGSRDEPVEVAGASHFLEHLLFKGTIARSARAINRAVDAIGGDFNAYTVREFTVFYVRVPAPHQRFAAELLCEVIANPRFDPADIEVERSVIMGELDGAIDSPDDMVFMNLSEAMFDGHSLGRETLGNVDTIMSLDKAEISTFHDWWYRSVNLVFAGAGAVDHDELAEIIEKNFADRPTGERPARSTPFEQVASEVSETRQIEQVHLALGWRGVAAVNPDRVALSILNHALGDGPSSRLHEEVRERRGLAYHVSSSAASNIDVGSQTIYCATAPNHLDTVRSVIAEQVQEIVENGIDDEELSVAKGYLSGSMLMALEDSASRMSRLGSAISTHGRTIPIAESLDSVDVVTHEDIRRVAATVFDAPMVTSIVGPSR